MKNKNYLGLFTFILLSGCAGSASHKVVTSNPAIDQGLTCRQLDDEIARSQAIINGVNDDKNDLSGSDVLDGVLYFPFNLIAKNSNYNNALTAANQRIVNLKIIKQDKNCPVDKDGLPNQANSDLETKLKSLNKMYQEKLISEEEYKATKLKLLGI